MTKYAFALAALLALTLTSLGLAAGSPSAGGIGLSGAASPGISTASGRCSKAEATTVVKQLRLGESSLGYPVVAVLCGSFTGPGSQTMVVTLAGPTGPLDWVVLRWAGGAWQFLMRQGAGASIIAAGSDIRQTVSILREGDSRCCPTGGTKSRIWHWNGSRFVATAWKQVTTGTVTPTGSSEYGFFKTPSGNILCGYAHRKGSASVECVVKSGLKPPPPRRGPDCSPTIVVSLGAPGRVRTGGSVCPGEDAPETPYVGSGIARVLGYGKTWSGGGLRCSSAITRLTCRNKSGHGFFLSRENWRAF